MCDKVTCSAMKWRMVWSWSHPIVGGKYSLKVEAHKGSVVCESSATWIGFDHSGKGHNGHFVIGVEVSSDILYSSPPALSVPAADILRPLSFFSLLCFLRALREQFPSLLK